ncbi:hypothetical protein F4680DRAFT_349871 [Xylaria scruposa]|nr:hypothetical protein F4680DRAFT_349871 [Xylaria scruposa]
MSDLSEDETSNDSQLDNSRDSPEHENIPDVSNEVNGEDNCEDDCENNSEEDDDSENETLPRSFEFLRKFPAEQGETEDQYINRIEREFQRLRDKHPEFAHLTFNDLKPVRGPKGALDPTWGPNVEMLITNVRNSARVSLLIDLVGCNIDILLNYAMRGLNWPEELNAYAYFTARKRLKSNMSTWKHRALKNLKSYVQGLMDQDVEGDFAAEKELPRLQRYLERRFNVDDFIQIFDWVKPIVNMHNSSEKLRTWCLILFTELGAYAKRNIDWENSAVSQRTDPFNKENYLNRFDVLAEIPQLQEFRPERSDVKIMRTTKIPTHKTKARKEGVTDHLHDPHVFIPRAGAAGRDTQLGVTSTTNTLLLENNAESGQQDIIEQPRKKMKQMGTTISNKKKTSRGNVNIPFKPVARNQVPRG